MKKLIYILALLFIVPFTLDAQSDNNTYTASGYDFWICFMKNYKTDPSSTSKVNMRLFLTGDEDAQVTIEIKAINFKKTVKVQGGTVKSIEIPSKAEIRSSEVIEKNHAVHIHSNQKINVYGLNSRFETTDTFLALPVTVLGTEYRAMCYSMVSQLMPQFAIVATEDNTLVSMIPEVETKGGIQEGEFHRIKLDKGDVYQVASKKDPLSLKRADLTGSFIRANKKIAVFSGHQCAYVPFNVQACNHLVEQIPPIHSWGKHFYIGDLKDRSKYVYRVLSHQKGTKVFENSKLKRVLDEGEFFENISDKNVQVTASKPVLVSQYSMGYKNGDSIGDPMMIMVSPTQQFLKKYRFATPINGEWNHYINVVVPTKTIGSLKLNGFPIDSAGFKIFGISRYSIASLKIPYGTHTISAREPFGLYSYGFGYGKDSFDAYGNMTGQSFAYHKEKIDSIPPIAEIRREKNKAIIIFSDDRVGDVGMRDVEILSVDGFKHKHMNVEEGAPHLEVNITPNSLSSSASIVLRARDAELNESFYTICYTADKRTSKYTYYLNEGTDVQCVEKPGYFIGANLQYSYTYHDANFSSTGDLNIPGTFSSDMGKAGFLGLSVSKEWKHNLWFSGRLTFQKLGGTISAPDSAVSQVRNPETGALEDFQESHLLSLNALFVDVALATEWHFEDFMYLAGGVNFKLAMTKSIELEKEILKPSNRVYADGNRTKTLAQNTMDSMSPLTIGVFGGIGVQYHVNAKWKVYWEGLYNYSLGNVINDGDWTINMLTFNLGVKMKI